MKFFLSIFFGLKKKKYPHPHTHLISKIDTAYKYFSVGWYEKKL